MLLKRGLDFSFRKIWLFPIFLLMPSIVGLSLLLAIIGGEPAPEITALSQPWIVIPAFFYILLLGGPVEEEFGWRGYALDRLQRNFNALLSSIIIGFIWDCGIFPYSICQDRKYIIIFQSGVSSWEQSSSR
jgi:membrane protease YdiL (CAAX protease family)